MGGWHLRMTWGQEVCYASLHSEPASALDLPTVWSLWGNPGMPRCFSTLPAGHISQRKVTSVISSGSLGFIVCVWNVVGWLIVYQDGDYLYSGRYSQTICQSQIGWCRLWGRNSLMARPSTLLISRSWWGHECGKFIIIMKFDLEKRSCVKTMMLLKKWFLPKRLNKSKCLAKEHQNGFAVCQAKLSRARLRKLK